MLLASISGFLAWLLPLGLFVSDWFCGGLVLSLGLIGVICWSWLVCGCFGGGQRWFFGRMECLFLGLVGLVKPRQTLS